jgi:hypothetical protein
VIVMRTTVGKSLAGLVVVSSLALGGCALPFAKSVQTLPPSPSPSPAATKTADPTPEELAYELLKSNWADMSASDKDDLCQYWKTSPNQAWEAFQEGESAGYLSKSKFTEFFSERCM